MTQRQAGVLWVVGCAAVIALLGLGAYVVGTDIGNGPDDPAPSNDARSAMNTLWADMDTGERIDFCTEARASGYDVLVNEVVAQTRYEAREVRYWLEDTCG